MTTRTKIALCVGLLAVAVVMGVAGVLRLRSPTKSAVEVKFVRYAGNGSALLNITNHGPSAVRLYSRDLFLWSKEDGVPIFKPLSTIILDPGWLMPVETASSVSESDKIIVVWRPMRYRFSRLIDGVFFKAGVNLAGTGFVTTVTLPRKETNAPVQLVTP